MIPSNVYIFVIIIMAATVSWFVIMSLCLLLYRVYLYGENSDKKVPIGDNSMSKRNTSRLYLQSSDRKQYINFVQDREEVAL